MQKFLRSLLPILLISLMVSGPGWAQNQVLARHGSYQLTQADLASTVELLNFLTQDQLTQNELVYLAQHSVHDFQKAPAQFLSTTQQLTAMINQLKASNDPMKAAHVRLKVLGEARAFVQNRPYQEWPATYQLLFQKAPIVAYDSNSKMVLTRQDLAATLKYLGQAYVNQGQTVTQKDFEQAATQLATNFANLDLKSQFILGSGTILLQLYQRHPQMLASASNQQRNSTGGPPSNSRAGYTSSYEASRHRAVNQQIMTNLYNNMNQNHATMMNYLETNPGVEWSYSPSW